MKRSRLKPGKPPQRRVGLKSYTGFKPRTKPMNKVSTQKRRVQRKLAKDLYCDSFGVAFGEAYKWLELPKPADPNERQMTLEQARPMRKAPDPRVCAFMHQFYGEPSIDVETRERSTYGLCWLCEEQQLLTAHHVVSKWDALGNICMCCWPCHELVQHSQAELKRVLRAMCKHNKFLSWVHLARARGSLWSFSSLD